MANQEREIRKGLRQASEQTELSLKQLKPVLNPRITTEVCVARALEAHETLRKALTLLTATLKKSGKAPQLIDPAEPKAAEPSRTSPLMVMVNASKLSQRAQQVLEFLVKHSNETTSWLHERTGGGVRSVQDLAKISRELLSSATKLRKGGPKTAEEIVLWAAAHSVEIPEKEPARKKT